MITFKALTAGVRSTNKSYRMIALLYAINFLIAGILAWGFHSVLVRTIGDSMSLERLVKDFDYTVFTDFMFKYGGRIAALFSQLSWLIFFYLLLSTLLGGGTIAILKNGEEHFSLQSFFENCGVFFFRFLRLLLIFGAILLIVGFIASAAFGLIYSAFALNAVSEVWPFTFAIILIFLFLFVVMLIVMMADYAKVATVANDAGSMLKTSWQGIKFVFRHFLSTVGLQLSVILFLLVSIVVYLLLESQIGMATPIAILVMFVIQQVSVGFKVWTRVLTFAGELELFEEFGAATELRTPIPAAVPTPPSTPVLAPEEQLQPVIKKQPEKRKRVTRRPPVRKTPVARKRTPRKTK